MDGGKAKGEEKGSVQGDGRGKEIGEERSVRGGVGEDIKKGGTAMSSTREGVNGKEGIEIQGEWERGQVGERRKE